MQLGKIQGKITTNTFSFIAEAPTKKFQYLEIKHPEYGSVLAQVVELESTDKVKALCHILGYCAKGNLRPIRTPFEKGASVESASDEFLAETLQFKKEGMYLGLLEGKKISVKVDAAGLLTKHVAVLAKTGSGKSYATGVLIEELVGQGYPVVVIDPHSEYMAMRHPNESKQADRFGVKAAGLGNKVQGYGNIEASPEVRPLRLSEQLSQRELINMLPAKLSNAQLTVLYSVLKRKEYDFEELHEELTAQDSPHKWGVIHALDYLQELGLFSRTPTNLRDLVIPGKVTVIDLKGYEPYIQEIIVYKLLSDLFEWRKVNRVPPFFLVVEEAHNFIPERSFGEAKSSGILRTIASEGRKFGLGLCVITQRPARIDKNVLSQCSTQVILKVTNPNDLRAITSSLESVTQNTENEIKNLPIGTALVAGVVDMPLFVEIRPRKTKHGGEAQTDHVEDHKQGEALPVIMPSTSKQDVAIIEGVKEVTTHLIPAVIIRGKKGLREITWLIELVKGCVVTSVDEVSGLPVPDVTKLSKQQTKVLESSLKLGEFVAAEVGLKSGIGALAVQDVLGALVERDMLESDGRKYKLTQQMEMVRKPDAFQVPKKIAYVNLHNPTKRNAKVDIDRIKPKIEMFMKVIDTDPCWIVQYKPEK